MPLGSSPAFLHEDEEVDGRTMKYLPIDRLYSSTSPCINPSGSSSVMSKKVKARKLIEEEDEEEEKGEKMMVKKEPFLLVYRRRNKKKPRPCDERSEGDHHHQSGGDSRKKAKKNYELLSLDSSGISGPRHLRRSGGLSRKGKESDIGCRGRCPGSSKESSSAFSRTQRWVELDFDGVEPNVFVGMTCKVFWPMDDNWYKGSVSGYNSVTRKHCIEYNDGDVEHLSLTDEKIKFHLSTEEVQHWNLKYDVSSREKKGLNYNEMLALAASFDDCQDLEPGDLVWAKLTGHAMWPAVIVDESNIGERGVLQLVRHNQSVLVQFFGTHDFARINSKQAIPFLNGLLSSLHLKCKQTRFGRSLEEAKEYLRDQQLPETMLQMRKSNSAEGSWDYSREKEERIYSCEDHGEDMMQKTVECNSTLPLEIGNLRVTSLGKVVCNSMHFHDKKHIWPEGYTAFRTFTSMRDPSMETSYKMEVLRNPKVKSRPLFRVTSDDGQQIDGPNPSACWKEIYERIRQSQNNLNAEAQLLDVQSPGSEMFGFKNPKVAELIQDLPNARFCSKYFKRCGDFPEGFRAVHVDWNDLDRCSVCNNDEEYEDNLFLQCDKCRMMVHARCYGELESLDGVLWFCNLCRPGAPKSPPRCCLCPVTGGALKPTTDGRWAHLACAIWIPETCLVDVKRMEPIDGLARINKDRWKLLCSICTVGYGACIQCSHCTCRVAYHPLCARAEGLCVELEGEDGTHLMSFEEDGQCIRLLSFCKKHRQTGNDGKQVDENVVLLDQCASKYVPASNTSGCARTEPYNLFGRRGRKEPQVLAAASVKRLFVENMPHLVRDYYQNGVNLGFHGDESQLLLLPGASKGGIQHVASANISSMAEKYHNMKITFRKRLAFGQQSIH
ncbi:histone-lysine N-methyltransferase TRX1-like [Asparagus officinalis]|uniref:histone-lysine N-methyltransferase TRX1-like n=1 Tax=Asparagus officinalis TaxID=4686 RepID=UPI00098E1EBB|nr:histone-lysine N-methyltransferase TRX1-like [Asparagus officinalis]